jgi:hypothetical protein
MVSRMSSMAFRSPGLSSRPLTFAIWKSTSYIENQGCQIFLVKNTETGKNIPLHLKIY